MKSKIMEVWTMLRLSGRVLRKNPFLCGYLAASVLAVTALLGTVSYPVLQNIGAGSTQILEPYASIDRSAAAADGIYSAIRPRWRLIALAAAGVYLPGTLALVFFNVALLASVRRILNGQPVDFVGGLRLAWERRSSIIQWTLFSATVGIAIELVRNKLDNWLAQRVLGLVGLGWTLATFLAIPVLVVEGGTPLQALRRSARLFARTWGQNVVATISVEAFELTLWLLVGLLPGVAMFWIGLYRLVSLDGSHMGLYFLAVSVPWIALSLLPIKLGGELVKTVFRMSLYVYATEGVIPEEYKDQDCAWFVGRRLAADAERSSS